MPDRRRLLQRAAILALAPLARARAQPARLWRFGTEYPATAISGEGIAAFAQRVAWRAEGQLAIEPSFDAPQGLRSAAMPAAVAEGRLEAADAFTGALGAEGPVFELSALPFLTADTRDTARLLAAAREAYAAALGNRGLGLLYATPWPATGLWSRTALAGAEALRGLRVRTYDAASTAVLRAAGAAPERLSFADALPRLREGALDAVLSSGDGGAGARLWEVLPHFTMLDYASPLSLAFCNQRGLDALPAPTRQAVAEAARETEARQFEALRTRQAENEARMRANGVQIAPGAALRPALEAAARPVVESWEARTGATGAAILRAYRSG